MIQQLISNIIQELKTELNSSNGELQIQAFPLTKPIDENQLPQIAIYPEKLTINQNCKNSNLPHYNSPKGIIALREFQQYFLIEICDNDLAKIEEITSLITGIILTNQDKLIQNYNIKKENNSEKPATQYTSKTVSNTHIISQINLLGGIYTILENPFTFQLKLEVFGQIKLIKTVTEEAGVIEEVEISYADSK